MITHGRRSVVSSACQVFGAQCRDSPRNGVTGSTRRAELRGRTKSLTPCSLGGPALLTARWQRGELVFEINKSRGRV
jgi:hypothetical protein